MRFEINVLRQPFWSPVHIGNMLFSKSDVWKKIWNRHQCNKQPWHRESTQIGKWIHTLSSQFGVCTAVSCNFRNRNIIFLARALTKAMALQPIRVLHTQWLRDLWGRAVMQLSWVRLHWHERDGWFWKCKSVQGNETGFIMRWTWNQTNFLKVKRYVKHLRSFISSLKSGFQKWKGFSLMRAWWLTKLSAIASSFTLRHSGSTQIRK